MHSTRSRRSEPSTAATMCAGRLSSVGRAFRPAQVGRRVEIEPELGGDHDLPAKRRQRFADQFFIRVGAVDLGRVEERDAALDGGGEQGGHLALVLGRAVRVAHAHAAEAERRDFEAGGAEFAGLHGGPFVRRGRPGVVSCAEAGHHLRRRNVVARM
jgi:hypothetical protein